MIGSASPALILARRDIRSFGDAPKQFTLLSGWAAQYHDGRNGERQILGIMLPGETWHGISSFGIIAVTECLVSYDVADVDFKDVVGLDDLATTQSLLIAIGNNDAAGRIAFVLNHLFARLDRLNLVIDRSVVIPLTQADLGSMCCVTPVHISRVLGFLGKEGIIKRNGKHFTILLPSELARLARTEMRRPQRYKGPVETSGIAAGT